VPQTLLQRLVAVVMLVASAVLIALIAREVTTTEDVRPAATTKAQAAAAPARPQPRPVTTASSPPVRLAPAKKTTAPPVAALVLTASGGNSWLEVRSASAQGPVLFSGVLPAGESVNAAAKQLWVRFGGASNVTATLNGKPLALRAGTYSALVSRSGLQLVGS
jgi:hypothetical protein